MPIFLQLLVLFISSLVLTHLLLLNFRRRGWFDVPNHRSSHEIPVPKSGGVGFVLVITGFVLMLYWQGVLGTYFVIMLFALLVLACMGLMDDFLNLPVSARLAVQLFFALVLAMFFGGLPPLPLPGMQFELPWLGYLAGIIGIMWLVNLFNFMDGIDGIAILQAIFVMLAAACFAWLDNDRNGMQLALGLSAACAGFACLNLPPARLFMGDVGSNFLGGLMSVLGLFFIQSGALTLWTWLILLAAFLVDSTYTLVRRVLQKEVWYHAHRSHAYQKAASRFQSHGKVDIVLMLINVLWLFPLAWVSVQFPQAGALVLCIACLPLLLICYYLRAGVSNSNNTDSNNTENSNTENSNTDNSKSGRSLHGESEC